MAESNASNRKKQEPKQRYLEALAKGHPGREAARKARVSYHTVLAWRAEDPEFASAEADAKESLADKLEAITAGVAMKPDHPQSTTNRIFLLKALRPEKFKERTSNEHSGPGGAPIPVAATVNLGSLSTDELLVLEKMADKATAKPPGPPPVE